jgi:1-acyl-sn-glycerol-3-phosphate acyltransferase
MLPAQAGAALLAQHSGATILPIGIAGSEMVWSPRTLPWGLFRRWPVEVRVGDPYRPSVPAGASQKQALAMITAEMMQRIAALLPESYQGHYRQVPPSPAQPTTSVLAETSANAPAEAEPLEN